MITTLIFDLGGVVMTLDQEQAIRRFADLGLADARQRLDAYTQQGIFGDLEKGLITAEQFRDQLSTLVHRQLTHEECTFAWRGYCREVPQRNLEAIVRLKQKGYRVVLLSNTNPFMTSWTLTNDFDGGKHSLNYYFDHCYFSYELKVMKPDQQFFVKVLEAEQRQPDECLFVDDGERNVEAARQLGIHTLMTENGEDWTRRLDNLLNEIEKQQ